MECAQEIALGSKEDHAHILHVLQEVHAAVHEVEETFVYQSVLVFNDAYDALLDCHRDWNLVHLLCDGLRLDLLITELNENLRKLRSQCLLLVHWLPHGPSLTGLLDHVQRLLQIPSLPLFVHILLLLNESENSTQNLIHHFRLDELSNCRIHLI